ncbi:MAG TPA: hypothetical protein VIK14_15710 [Ignavibacteria bacterium]
MSQKYIFEYKSLSNKTGALIYLFAFFAAFAGFLVFLILAFKVNIKYIWIANFFGLASLILGPFSSFSKLYCYFALTEDNLLIMKSVIKMIPRSYIVELKKISEVISPTNTNSGIVHFRSPEGETLAKFNYNKMGYGDLKKYLGILSEKNNDIEVKI